MNPQRDPLSEALRDLRAASPKPSPELGARLSRDFARHHVWRRRQRAALAIGFAACLAISIYWLWPQRRTTTVQVAAPAAQPAPAPPPRVGVENGPKLPVAPVARASARPRVQAKSAARPRSHDVEAPAAPVEAADFVALPSFDPAVPVGDSRMVRMDLPGSALQLMGYPVEGQLLDRRIVTDVLVGQDGMPYAVRLVQSRNVR